MRITKKTKYYKIRYLFKRIDIIKGALGNITPADVEAQKWPNLRDLTMGDYFALDDALQAGDTAFIMAKYFPHIDRNTTAFEILCRFKWLLDGFNDVRAILKSCEIVPDETEKEAAARVPDVHPQIMAAAFCIDKFNLHSFEEAERVRLGDYLMYKRVAANELQVQREIMSINRAKANVK